MAENLDLSYVSLINRVIQDYNEIENSLLTKHTDLTQGQLKTSEYAGKIGRLTYINWADGETEALHRVTGIYSGTLKVANSSSGGFVREGSAFKITSNLIAPQGETGFNGLFIRNGVNLETTIDSSYIKTIELTGTLEETFEESDIVTLTVSDASYTITPNYIVNSVVVKKGTVTTEAIIPEGKSNAITFNRTLEAAASVVEEADKTNITVSDDETDYMLTVKTTSTLKDVSISGKTLTTVTEGYVTDGTFETPLSKTIAESATQDDEITIYLPKGGVSISNTTTGEGASTATASITAPTAYTDIFTTETDNIIPLNASVVGELGLKVTYNEGYVKGGASEDIDSKQITISDGSVNLRKGTTKDIEYTPSFDSVTGDGLAAANDQNVISLEVTTAAGTFNNEMITRHGYITATDAAKKLIVKGNKQTVNVKKSSGITATASVTGYTLGGDSSTLTTSDTSDYKLEVTPAINAAMSLADGGRVGYVSALSEITTAEASVAAKEIYIKRGSVSLNAPALTGIAVNHSDDDGVHQGESGLGFEISRLPADLSTITGDYVKLTTTSSLDFTRGFVDALGSEASISHDYYIPKATFAWEETEDGDEALHVLTGGYVPSGIISDLSTITDISGMTSSVTLSFNKLLLATVDEAVKANYEEIDLNAVINAGYISQNSNSITNNKFFLKKAKIDPTAGLSFTGAADGVINADAIIERNEDNTYSIPVEAVATANYGAGAEAGYLAELNTTAKAEKTENLTLNLRRPVLGTSQHTTNVIQSASASLIGGNAQSDYKDSAYYIDPKISSCSVTFNVTQSGYISSEDTDILVFNESGEDGTTTGPIIHAGNRERYYIKTADTSGIRLADATQAITATAITGGLIDSSALSGTVYQIDLGGTVSAKIAGLDTGYYGTTEVTAATDTAKSIAIPQGTFFNINKGSVSVAVNSATSTLSSTGNTVGNVTLYGEAADANDTGAKFAKISSTATIGTTTTVTEGYVRNVEADKTEGSKTVTGEAYVKLFETSSNLYSDAEVYDFTIGNANADATLSSLDADETVNTTTIPTAGKYMRLDTVVELNEHAMGNSVVDKLLELQNRLNGIRPTTI